MSNIFLYLRRYIGVERYFIPLLDQDFLLRRKGKMLKVDAVLLEQILGIVTPSFPVGEWFVHIIYPLTYYVNMFLLCA